MGSAHLLRINGHLNDQDSATPVKIASILFATLIVTGIVDHSLIRRITR